MYHSEGLQYFSKAVHNSTPWTSLGFVFSMYWAHGCHQHTHSYFWANLWQLLPETPVFKHPWELKTRVTRETWLDSPVKHSLLHSYTGLTSKKCFSGWTHQSKWKVKSCYYAVDSPPAMDDVCVGSKEKGKFVGKLTASHTCKGSQVFGSLPSFTLWHKGHLPSRG